MNLTRIAVIAGVGSTIEGFDFAIYGLLAQFLAVNFFGSWGERWQQTGVLIILTLSGLVRPLSGFVIGVLGDRYGRKRVFLPTAYAMIISTLLIGLLPTEKSWGVWAGLALMVCRVTQNLIVGGDYPGIVAYLLENAYKRRGLYFGIMFCIMGLGSSLASGLVAFLVKQLTSEQMLAWGYRVPFIVGALMGLGNLLLRRSLPESPQFLEHQARTKSQVPLPIRKVFHRIWPMSLLLACAAIPPGSISFVKSLFPNYLAKFYHYDVSKAYWALTLAYALSGPAKLLVGVLSDRSQSTTVPLISVSRVLFGFWPMTLCLRSGAPWAIWVFILYLQVITSLSATNIAILIASCFPVEHRYAGTAFSNNLCSAFAALMPHAMNYCYGTCQRDSYFVLLMMGLAFLAASCLLYLRRRQAYY